MQLELQHPDFMKQQLIIETAGIFRGPRLLLNGVAAEKVKGGYRVTNDAGGDVLVRLRYNYFDPIPKVELNGAVETLADPLSWYEWVWIALPALLVPIGGFTGALLGALAATANGRVFRGDNSTAWKWIYSAAITAVAAATYLGVARSVQSLRTPSVESQLQRVAADFNRDSGKIVGADTRLDGAAAGPGKLLTVRFTVLNLKRAEVLPAAIFEAREAPAIRDRVCASDMKQFLAHGVTLKYVYHLADGSPFGEVRIAPAHCP
jgi:hypothetical protein